MESLCIYIRHGKRMNEGSLCDEFKCIDSPRILGIYVEKLDTIAEELLVLKRVICHIRPSFQVGKSKICLR